MLEFIHTQETQAGLFFANRLDADDGAYVQLRLTNHRTFKDVLNMLFGLFGDLK